MSRRYFLTFAAVALFALASPMLRRARAQDVPPAVDNSKNAALGEITGDAVYVRSGAGDNYYPTMKLNAGATITVVGERFDWLKILPPEGSFCYIAKAFVDKAPSGDSGVVNRAEVNVRAGSSLNAMKTTVQAKLAQGQQVKILGEQDEYYKIAPPGDAFVYVKKEYVRPIKPLPQVAGNDAAPRQGEAVPATPATPQTAEITTPSAPQAPADTIAGGATTQPANPAVAAGATTQPASATASAEQQFDKLEADFATASAKTIETQPIDELLAGYQKVIADPQLPESMRRLADFRVQTLKARSEARAQFVIVLKQQEEAKKRTQTLKAEQEEIAQQLKKNEIKMFAAVGELRTSSLQHGPQILYRLTDPANGRTVCYLRSDDQKVAGMIGQFIGVKGQLATEPALGLRTVTASEVEPVDPNQVFRQIASEVVPPSLLPQGAQAASSTGQE
jgi:hypothetical protein